ncbi:hypothetical protein [Salibacterium lacus]|uniref:Uncharacterized protein n=1 Tax=Salibacterium lacus TaxID=1898109 RepID=A0ABW5SZC1_9BACI
MAVFDTDLIFSWSPWEYEMMMKGVQHKEIDRYDFMAQSALAREGAHRAKRPRLHQIFDAKKARRRLETGIKEEEEEIKRMIALNRTFQGFQPDFRKKGGS